MKIRGVEIKFSAIIALALYYGFAQYLPESFKFFRVGGGYKKAFMQANLLQYGKKCEY